MKSFGDLFQYLQSMSRHLGSQFANSSSQTKIVLFVVMGGMIYAVAAISKSPKIQSDKDDYALRLAQEYQNGSSNVKTEPVSNVKEDITDNANEVKPSKSYNNGYAENENTKENPLDLLEPQSRKLADKILKGDKIVSDREASICKCETEYSNADSCGTAVLLKAEDLALKSAMALENIYADIVSKDEATQKKLGACNERKKMIDEIMLATENINTIVQKLQKCQKSAETAYVAQKNQLKLYQLRDLSDTRARLKNQSNRLSNRYDRLSNHCDQVAKSLAEPESRSLSAKTAN